MDGGYGARETPSTVFTLDHGLSGALLAPAAERILARVGPDDRPPLPARWIWILAFLSPMAPDLDFLWTKFDRRFYDGEMGFVLSHRGITHSALGCVLLAGLVSWLFRRRFPEANARRAIFGIVLCGGLLHCIEDLPTPSSPWHGLVLLWPLPWRVGDWDLVGWFDFVGNAILVVGCAATLLTRRLRPRAALAVSLASLVVFVHHVATSRYLGWDVWLASQKGALPAPVYAVYETLFLKLGWVLFVWFPGLFH